MTDPILLNNRVEILPDAPLPALDGPGGEGFAARGARERKTEFFALVCSGGRNPRMELLSSAKLVEHPAAMRLFDWGVVEWPRDGTRRFVLVFEKPSGSRLSIGADGGLPALADDQAVRALVRPLASALKELSARGIFHGAIRPDNLFHRDSATGGIMLGECLSTPPGIGQPVLFETIERGMCLPSGRGPGTLADDLYSLGVTLLVLVLGRNPVADLSDDELIQAKIERGTYPALVGQMRFQMAVMEPLRGLLIDDPKQRWTLNDLELWLSGRRLSPKQSPVPKRAVRPFAIGGGEYLNCRSLARAFGRNVPAAAQHIENGDLDKWLRRSLGDEERADAVEAAVGSVTTVGRAANFHDRLVARISIALDPAAPIRFKGKAVMPQGIGGALCEAFLAGETPAVYAELIATQLPTFWFGAQDEMRPEFVPISNQLNALRPTTEKPGYGHGTERLLYELNPSMPCISAQVQDQHAATIPELLTALDRAAGQPDRSRSPIDRHVAAFLVARHRKIDERMLAILGGDGDPARQALAELSILADMQRRYGPPALPNLARWMLELVEPAIVRFQNRPQQERIRRHAEKAAQEGNLSDILRYVDDSQALARDGSGFVKARQEFRKATEDIARLEEKVRGRQRVADGIGRHVAVLVSSGLACLVVAGIVLFHLVGEA